MSTTPGKRVTRSRAAATKTADEMNAPAKRATAAKMAASRRAKSDVEDLKIPADTIASAAAKRPSQAAMKAASTINGTRRRIKVTPLDMPAPEDKSETDAAADKSSTKKSKGSAKENNEPKSATSISHIQQQLDDPEKATKPKTRRKAVVSTAKVDEKQPVTKPQGRPKRTIVSESIENPQQQQPVRQTRTRAGSGAAATQATAASTAKATAATRKKVTFQELPESDKENQPLVAKKLNPKGQGATGGSGLRAKPVRKPATTKGRKTAGTANKTAPEEAKPMPLSPKKVVQVAKSSSPDGSDEDELSGAKTPIRDLSQSPKRSAVFAGSLSPVKKLDFGAALLSKSPEKGVQAMTLLSPGRKLPASPFKDALKESPKRGEGALIFPSSALKVTTANVMSAPTPQSRSILLQSPKRGALDSSIFVQSAIKPLKSPAKPTLMQSPPKRLFLTSNGPGPEVAPARVNQPPSTTGGQDIDDELGDVVASCNFRPFQSPESSMKVHKISSEDLALGAPVSIDFDESVLDVRSPMKVSKPILSPLQSMNEEMEPLPVFSAVMSPTRLPLEASMSAPERDELYSRSIVDGGRMEGVTNLLATEDTKSGPASLKTAAPKDMPSFLFHSARFHDDEESSEDELQSDITSFRSAQRATPITSGKTARTRISTINPAETSRNVGFTPLAAQLSSWLATSPDKSSSKDPRQPGLFSPLAAQHVPGKVQISRQSTPRRSIGARSPTVAVGSANRRDTTSTMPAFESVAAGTPEKSSYFADEMAIKDLENEAEAVQATRDVHAKSPEIYADTDVPAFVGEEPPADVHDLEFGDLDDTVLIEEAANEAHTQDSENALTIPATPDALLFEGDAEAAVDGVLAATIMEVPFPRAEAEISTASEDRKHSDYEIEDLDREVTRQPTSLVDEYATPSRQSTLLPRFANTVVSKVPLRPEGYISPIKITKKRSRSLSAGPSSAKKPIFAPSLVPRSNASPFLSPELQIRGPASETPGQQSFLIDDFGDSTLDGIEIDEGDENLPPLTPSAVTRTTSTTAARTPLKAVKDGALQGAVVLVDVHTTEGADASGIFVELLTQMGARCVRQWNCNPRASIAGDEMETENVGLSGSCDKIGITHVVYKDGGKRTLEKVRDAGGVVRCVGVGWVLE